MLHAVFRFHERRCEIVIAIFDFDLQLWIRNHRGDEVEHHARGTGEVSEVAVVLPIPAIALKVRCNLIILVLPNFPPFLRTCLPFPTSFSPATIYSLYSFAA